MNIAFLFNVRHQYPDPNDPRSQIESDFDDPETTRLQIKALKEIGYYVIPVEANEQAYYKLYKNRKKIDIVLNFAEGIYGRDREAQIPALLEMLRIPYTGSSPLTSAIVLNKIRTKEILKIYNVPVLKHNVFENSNTNNFNLKFPVIVKPVSEGSSAGITKKSVVNNLDELKRQINFISKTFKEPAMVEPFLKGREFSVAMIGNPPQILPIIEPNHKILPKKYLPFDSLEVKWYFEEEGHNDYLICPAVVSSQLKNKIEKTCFNTWKALNIFDYCRIDIKCDVNDDPYVLEVNSPPGMMPPECSMTSYFPLAARTAGIDFKNLLEMIIKTALKRYKNK